MRIELEFDPMKPYERCSGATVTVRNGTGEVIHQEHYRDEMEAIRYCAKRGNEYEDDSFEVLYSITTSYSTNDSDDFVAEGRETKVKRGGLI